MLQAMPLSQKNVDELKKIYKETVGEELTDKEAWDMAIRLLNLFRVLRNAPAFEQQETESPH